jgi:hypothetical protein
VFIIMKQERDDTTAPLGYTAIQSSGKPIGTQATRLGRRLSCCVRGVHLKRTSSGLKSILQFTKNVLQFVSKALHFIRDSSDSDKK